MIYIQNKYGEKICNDNMGDTFNWGMLSGWIYEILRATEAMENN